MTQERPSDRIPPAPESAPGDGPCKHESSERAEAPGHAPAALRSLKQAMRRARYDDAEQAGAMADLRVARIGRLELLEEALQPLQEQIPPDVDLFDFGVMPGAHPRLFLDMIGFFEMARDARTYRLVQNTRHGRRVIAESDSIPRMVDAATDYVARRMLERDKALAADTIDTHAQELDRREAPPTVPPRRSAPDAAGPHSRTPAAAPRRGRSHVGRFFGAAFAILIDLLGAIAFFGILFALAWFAWLRLHGQS